MIIRTVEETGSTQADVAAGLAADPAAWPHLSALAARHQRAGRGRLDRAWDDGAGRSLLISWVLRPAPGDWSGLALLGGLALLRAVRALAGEVPIGVKWPNDVVLDAPGGAPGWAGMRKVGGVLGQVVTDGDGAPAAVLGLGVNLAWSGPERPSAWAGALADAGAELGADALAEALGAELGALVPAGAPVPAPGLLLAPVLRTLGARVRVDRAAGVIAGVATGLAPDGALEVTGADGVVHAIATGDVAHLRSVDDLRRADDPRGADNL